MFRKLFISILLVGALGVVATAQTAESHIKLGNKFFAREQYGLALNEYKKVRSNDGAAYSQSLYNIGVCHFELWETDEAITYYKLAIEARANNYTKASYALGVALESQSRWAEARLAYQQALTGDVQGATLFRLGVVATREGELGKARDLFRRALGVVGPHVPSSHNNLGVMLAHDGLLDEAEKQFALAVERSDGGFSEAVHNLKLCRTLQATAQVNGSFRLSSNDLPR